MPLPRGRLSFGMTQPPELDEATKARIRAEEAYRAQVRGGAQDFGRGLALLGAVLLAIGVFLPVANLPIIGSINFFGAGNRDGVFLLAFAILGAIFALTARSWVLFAALLSLAFLGWKFISFQQGFDRAGEFGRLIELGWGWAPMVIGALLMLWGALYPPPSQKH